MAGTVKCPQAGSEENEYHHLCARCRGKGHIPDGKKELAEFIQIQVELAANARKIDPNCSRRKQKTEPCGSYIGRDGPIPCPRCWQSLITRERELWPIVCMTFGAQEWITVHDQTLAPYLNPPGEQAKPIVVVSRGLPRTVLCNTLAEWIGGECAQCGGTGERGSIGDHGQYPIRCRTCNGNGHIHGIGSRLAQHWPIERVEIKDRSPLGVKGGIRWTNESRYSWGLPQAIFERLPTGPTCTMIRDAGENWASRTSIRDYESHDAADAAVSDAMIIWARACPPFDEDYTLTADPAKSRPSAASVIPPRITSAE